MNNKPSALSVLFTQFRRYSVTIFVVVLVGGLATAVLLLNQILQQSSDANGYTSSLDVTTFDQETINHVDRLHKSTDTDITVTLPDGRINPFTE
jgi:hypothetical protein